MKKIVVIGGGTMGLDIAQVFARNGYDVVVRDIKDEIIQASEARLNKGLDKLVSKGKLDEAKKAEILSHMSFTTELAAAADADLVVEAAIENLDIKKSIFAELDSLCKPETILASNTSSISITAIAAATKRADKFIGMHFFNPATVMKLVEVIRGAHTSDETYKTIAELAAAIGKEPVEVNEAPGFVVNKILVPMINEGIDLVYTVQPSLARGSRPVRSRTNSTSDCASGDVNPGRAEGDSSFISMPKPSNTPPVATCSPLPTSAPASAPIISAFASANDLSGAKR